MKTEELLGLGLSREQASSILAINGRDIERAKSANEKERLELERVLNELSVREKEIEDYRNMDYEGLKNELNSWKEKAEAAELIAKEQMKKSVLEDEKNRLYKENQVKSNEVLDALINWEDVKVDDNSVEGLKEQITGLREQYGYLFHKEVTLPQFSTAIDEVKEADGTLAVREAMGI